tara:strand:+ start:1735 stop:2010 length:276 start_codon:yes stop_codon:yes gene_type:complete
MSSRAYVVSYENLKTNEINVVAVALNLGAATELCIDHGSRVNDLGESTLFNLGDFSNESLISKTITKEGCFSSVDGSYSYAFNIENVEMLR